MPSRLRRAIGAVKDQTSIGLAKVTATATVTVTLDVPILRATSHDESPMDALHVAEILRAVASDGDGAGAAACAEAIARRLSRSRSWVVALKSLTLLLGVLHSGDPNFPREVRRVMKVVGFSGGSTSAPYDCAAFVRAFALYIDERLHSVISHRLDDIRSLNPPALINAVSHCQKLLDRAIAARPSGDAAASRLVLSSLRAVVRESFGLYRDVSDGLALLLDGFFRLPYQSCVAAFQACVRASRQFEDLAEFYLFCKAAGVGRTSEYPSVQRISAELLETLHEFLKDHASFSGTTSSEYGPRSDGGSAAAEEWEFSEAEMSKGSTTATTPEGLLDKSPPSVAAAPTFCVGGLVVKAVYGGGGGSDDPFETAFDSREIRDEMVVSCEQRLWLEHQKKIISKRIASNEFSL